MVSSTMIKTIRLLEASKTLCFNVAVTVPFLLHAIPTLRKNMRQIDAAMSPITENTILASQYGQSKYMKMKNKHGP